VDGLVDELGDVGVKSQGSTHIDIIVPPGGGIKMPYGATMKSVTPADHDHQGRGGARMACPAWANRWKHPLTMSGQPGRGDYRALYSIDDRKHAITVLAVAHRRDAYRSR
jgi:hypothetical protein